ncbi:MAG TPA: sugar transferase [Myxococcus sp.]|nr:sugar transferase [Myxococcus sp.]
MDWLFMLLVLPVVGPVALLTAAAILLDDGRPLFFVQPRMGRGGRTFLIRKFRTMRDGKVTRVGRFLRAVGFDELPQFVNIARGEMSVVGPRPLTRQDAERLDWLGSAAQERWSVAPGLTGPAQLNVGHGAERSLMLDLRYARHVSLSLDLELIALSLLRNLIGKKAVQRLSLKRLLRLSAESPAPAERERMADHE